ncbi:hypothetical protein E4U54_006085, partial [Claviceps lovelessii]
INLDEQRPILRAALAMICLTANKSPVRSVTGASIPEILMATELIGITETGKADTLS